MHRDPTSIAPDKLAAEAAKILERGLGGRLPVLDPSGHLLGVIIFSDLLAAGVV